MEIERYKVGQVESEGHDEGGLGGEPGASLGPATEKCQAWGLDLTFQTRDPQTRLLVLLCQ